MSTEIQELEYSYIDKKEWPEGPWQKEPDKIQWIDQDSNLDCLIVRVLHSGHLCGYVGVPENHPCFGVDDSNVQINGSYPDVHGGLTFSGRCNERDKDHGICHRPFPGRPDKIWWLGFHCAHGRFFSSVWRGGEYRTISFVRNECRKLAAQLTQAK